MKPVTARFPIIIKVVGIESGGIDIVSRLLSVKFEGVELIAVSRDAALLSQCSIGVKIHFDPRRNHNSTKSNLQLAENSTLGGDTEIERALKDADMIFVTITENDEPDVVPGIQKIARQMGVLVTAVASCPSTFGDQAVSDRGRDRRLRILREGVDTLLIMRDDAPMYEILTALGA